VDEIYDTVIPRAGAMIESLRAYGYTLNTAIADLIDNSISAKANNIWIQLHWDGEQSWIAISDDGDGMTESVLKNAMRLGSDNPVEERSLSDLGRFGLGLKTAAFSQCRSLTVASKSVGAQTCLRRWDLDYVVKYNEWRLLKDYREGAEAQFSSLNKMAHGSVVLLENLDRLCDRQEVENETHRRKFFSRVGMLSAHLSMVFHRYLASKSGIRIYINGFSENERIKPWDPFLSLHEATCPQPQESKSFHKGIVKVKGYVLPHKDKLNTDDHIQAAGLGGWNDQQGFYIYRNRRLLVAGSWLGLGGRRHGWTKEEHYKLARIKVDIVNTMDFDWKIDVKKSSAVPPPVIADWLENYAGHVRKEAREVFSHRGKYGQRIQQNEVARLWRPSIRGGAQIYKIDRNSELIKGIFQKADTLTPNIESMLRLLEETVPVQQIWLDIAEHSERSHQPMGGLSEKQVMDLVGTTLSALIGADRKPDGVTIDIICNMEGFAEYADVIRAKYLGMGD
jgi:hypothetical protein